MSKRTTATSTALTAAATLAAALLLGACGAEGGSGDEIKGAGKGGDASASASASAEDRGGKKAGKGDGLGTPEFDFPDGVKVDIADEDTGDPAQDEVLRDHGYALRAVVLSIAKADSGLPVAYRFLWKDAGEALKYHISKFKDDGQVGTGVYRYYDRKAVVQDKDSAVVTYCESKRDAFAKVVKTGKVLRTEPSDEDFARFRSRMEKHGGEWKAMTMTAKTGDPGCKR